MTRSHCFLGHPRRERKWRHMCNLRCEGIASPIDSIRASLFQSAQTCHGHRLRAARLAHQLRHINTPLREKIGRGRPWTQGYDTKAVFPV